MVFLVPTIILALLLGLAAGFVMHRSDFCMTAAFRDLFLFRTTTMLSALLILVAISSVFCEIVKIGGINSFSPKLFGLPTLITAISGGIFGVGMVLAGGCVVGTLYRLGAGSRLALWGLIGIIGGSALYAEIHPLWSAVKKVTALPESAISLPQWSGLPSWFFTLALVVITGILLWRQPQKFLPPHEWREVDGYIPPIYAALTLAGVGALSILLFGKPLGITTSYAKVAALLENILIPEHFARTAFFHTQLPPVVLPFSSGALPSGPGPKFDGIAVIQYPLISGIILGSGISAWLLGEWRWSRAATWRQTFSALIGGLLMGLASRMGSGCNIWHLWGGLPSFSLQSLLFLMGLFPGAWLGGRLLTRWVLTEKDKGIANG